jgi:ribonucleotide monophosphatase NagD (HAD superfamily)
MVLERLGTPRASTYVVGDRLETDIQGGQAEAWTPKIDLIAESLTQLVGA